MFLIEKNLNHTIEMLKQMKKVWNGDPMTQ